MHKVEQEGPGVLGDGPLVVLCHVLYPVRGRTPSAAVHGLWTTAVQATGGSSQGGPPGIRQGPRLRRKQQLPQAQGRLLLQAPLALLAAPPVAIVVHLLRAQTGVAWARRRNACRLERPGAQTAGRRTLNIMGSTTSERSWGSFRRSSVTLKQPRLCAAGPSGTQLEMGPQLLDAPAAEGDAGGAAWQGRGRPACRR